MVGLGSSTVLTNLENMSGRAAAEVLAFWQHE